MHLNNIRILIFAALLILFLAVGFTFSRPKPETVNPSIAI